ncbi:unnamed protein product [Effrenium voratum]|uniref:Cytochrome P450 n=1 Tax=Effrenium voratum TaxID=2562239 RepID=A0AA36I138_9DINO|nr:unnamed protein product [Effrenium voratum]CAJ1440832.1 unnamed protein product [Effrenium voratum]CAJ1449738.1 unnamed protein product [Effrenium voratum]
MPSVAGVDVPNWCLAGAAVLTPAAIYAYLLRVSRQQREFFAETPQPKETSLIFGGLESADLVNNPEKGLAAMKQFYKELGNSWGIRLPKWLFPNTQFLFLTADPVIISEIMSKKDIFHSRPKGLAFDTTIPLGLLSLRAEGPHSRWALHRRLASPLFSDSFLLGYSEQVQEKAKLMQFILNERIKAAKAEAAECDLQHCLKLLTLDVIGSIGFGFNSKATMTYLPEDHPQALSEAEKTAELEFLQASEVMFFETHQRTTEPWMMRYLPHRFMRWRWAKGVMDKRINAVLVSGKESSSGAKLNMLKALKDAQEGGQKMSKAEVTDEILTLLAAGHETTGHTTSWALYEVARHPEVQAKMLAEVSTVDLETLPLTQVQSLLPYSWMTWQEALRLHPTVPFIPRQAEVDTTLGGKYNLTAGCVVSVSQFMLAVNEEMWGPDAASFVPERMEKGYPEMHLPFGFGGRTCIGKRLAYVEGVYLLAFLVKNFSSRIGDDAPVPSPRVTVTQSAAEGIHLMISSR